MNPLVAVVGTAGKEKSNLPTWTFPRDDTDTNRSGVISPCCIRVSTMTAKPSLVIPGTVANSKKEQELIGIWSDSAMLLATANNRRQSTEITVGAEDYGIKSTEISTAGAEDISTPELLPAY